MRRLGAQLRKIREQRGLSLDEAADKLNMSKSALNRIENAQVITRRRDVAYLLMVYEVDDEDLRASLIGLAAAGRSKDWIKRNRSLAPGGVGEYVRLEQDSKLIRTFQPMVIPGMLQTAEYARAVMQSPGLDPSRDYDRSVAYRMARREVLARQDAALVAIVGEAALHHQPGGREVMRAQLRALLETASDNITLRVHPFAVRNPGVDGAFTLLDVETGAFTVAVLDALTRKVIVEDDDEVARYSLVFDDLCSTALGEAESRMFIERILGVT